MTIIIHDKMAIVLMVWLLAKFCGLKCLNFFCYVLSRFFLLLLTTL